MFQKLNLRTKLIAIAVPPLAVLGMVALYGVILSTRGAGDDIVNDVRTLGVVALAAFLLTALVGIVIGRSIENPVQEATAAARELADERLPALLDNLRNPGAGAKSHEPLTTDSSGELGDLIAALNDVQASAANVADEQQKMVRQGLSELVVNMARRNQTLLDRQIEYIDRLESNEEDPDRLEELFGLDHLATRMRRNAESLLVLAGAETTRRRGGPVAIGDVLRVAMSEIEDYRHVQMVNIEDAQIGAQGAVDLAHLLSEMMENATQFSPPDSPVEVNGTRHPDGTYFITIADHGIGMSPEQLESSNETLSAPPELGLGLTRSLGFSVIGRLARRLELEVELAHTSGGGITAIIAVPASALSDTSPLSNSEMPAAAAPEVAAPAPAPTVLPGETPPAPTAPPVDLGQAAFATTESEAWTPPAMPERNANSFAPSAEAAPAAPAAPATPAAEAPQSDALSKLLGLDPSTAAPAEAPAMAPIPTPAPAPSEPVSSGFDPADLFTRPVTESAAPTEPETEWQAPVFNPDDLMTNSPPEAEPMETLSAEPTPTAKLEEAIPTGDSFDQGVSGLLDEPSRTSTGLVKRDRSQSQAPVSEGRPVKASVRSPDEIRSMLARYRDGLKGRPLEGLAEPGSETPSDFSNSAAPSNAAPTNDPWGDPQ